MANAPIPGVLRHLRRMFRPPEADEQPDVQLLRRFLAGREEEAFAAIVQRHGPLVLNVCRRVLRGEQDAEDAFQATFLVLAKKAGSVGKREAVGSWLYTVARRIALAARARAARRPAQAPRGLEWLPAPADDGPKLPESGYIGTEAGRYSGAHRSSGLSLRPLTTRTGSSRSKGWLPRLDVYRKRLSEARFAQGQRI